METPMLNRVPQPILLRFALLADAAASGLMGVLTAAGAGLLAPFLGLPSPLLFWAGLLLIPFALFVAWTGTREQLPSGAVGAVVIVNLAWVAGSFALLALLPHAPTALGYVFVIAQALAVLVLALMQWIGVGRAGRAPVASIAA
jgi:hypothetical protein